MPRITRNNSRAFLSRIDSPNLDNLLDDSRTELNLAGKSKGGGTTFLVGNIFVSIALVNTRKRSLSLKIWLRDNRVESNETLNRRGGEGGGGRDARQKKRVRKPGGLSGD